VREVYDVHRSVIRFLATVLPEFDIWPQRQEPQEDRPYAVCIPVTNTSITGVSPCLDFEQPFAVYLYPAPALDGLVAQREKMRVEERLYRAFIADSDWSIPLYDYSTGGPGGSELALDENGPPEPGIAAYDQDGAVAIYDSVRVRDYQIHSARDADDERRFSIVLTLRLAWRSHGRLVYGVPVQTVTVSPRVH